MVSKSALLKDLQELEEDYDSLEQEYIGQVAELEELLAVAEKERDKLRGHLSRVRTAHDELHRVLYPTSVAAGYPNPFIPLVDPPTLPPDLATGTFMNTSS